MKPRRPTFPLLLQRSLLALLLSAALLIQGRPPSWAAAPVLAGMASDTSSPCHEEGGQKNLPIPEKAKGDPFACCATFACGMMFQALPPDLPAAAPAFASTFARPSARELPDLPQPDPAWRPPTPFL